MNTHEVIIFYKYTPVQDPVGFVNQQKLLGASLHLTGRILIAPEGMNGTVEGTPEQIAEYERHMRLQDGLEGTFADLHDVWFKSSPSNGTSFKKLKIKARPEILNIGLGKEQDIDPNSICGKHLSAEELNSWFENGEDFEIIDMRNSYEYAVGRFKGSHDSGMLNFRDLPEAVNRFEHLKEKKIVTVCTYGVRCEKASGYLLKQGFNNVYQLHGGIGTFMKTFPGKQFEGSLYVFDERITERFTEHYDIVGTCFACSDKTERFGNCAWSDCHKQLIICDTCDTSQVWCSQACKDRTATVCT